MDMQETEHFPDEPTNRGLPRIANRIVSNPFFDYFIIALILLSGAFLGLGTVPEISDDYGDLLTLGNQVILGVFIVEAIIKMVALAPRPQRYFLDGWNIFDFAIIVFSLVRPPERSR